ncbi:ras-GEF domain-containing family member 1B [Episyrphus balteatus]|uniref:ras-GEF domain-containing family member 1B n=1 Tax=Episyrphus balteatus TaxID=286459 RepID=UPI00248601F7|nr:ras-GEF domain-containing family member 1B [Episyrphus balteatus]
MAMYYYASKISAIACGTRCKQTVLQKSRGQRDRDKFDAFGYIHDNENAIDMDFGCQEVSTFKTVKSCSDINADDVVQYDRPKISYPQAQVVNYENSVLGSGGIMYVDGKIVSGPLDSLVDILVPKNVDELDKDFVFSFILSSRLFLRPHELLGKLLSSVPDSESLATLAALLAEWTHRFPYDFRDERIMSHVKHIVSRCSNTGLEELVSEILSALLKRLTELEKHEGDLRACQSNTDKIDLIDCPTASHYAQILCRIERKLAKHVGPEEFLQCSNNVLLDKQSKKWDQPSTSGGPPGVQDPKKTCNLETYLEWSARLRLFVCNEILRCNSIRERKKIVELWSGVAQYCLLVGNYNSATAILETLESPPIARLKVTWSKLSSTCQQLDCMQRHAEGYGDLWTKQAIVLNENQKTDHSTTVVVVVSSTSTTAATSSSTTTVTGATTTSSTTTTTMMTTPPLPPPLPQLPVPPTAATLVTTTSTTLSSSSSEKKPTKPNDWVVIPVFADIVKLAISGREDCLQRLPNGHINVTAFDRVAAIAGAFTKHMSSVKAPSTADTTPGEYEAFCRHMQKTSTLNESELMMASFDCEEPNNAEKLMYDLN